MDKFRALQYFVAAAEARSFSGAARRHEVSVAAVAKLVTALERSLGTNLFDRSTHGLSLTVDGEAYHESCAPLLAELAATDEAMRSTARRPRGTLVVGAPGFLAQHVLLPALPDFHARYPELQIDLRHVARLGDAAAGAVDVFVLLGWPDAEDRVIRRIALQRFLVCASPAYWARHGQPQRPEDLQDHNCLLFRNPAGTLLDLWQFDRGSKFAQVNARGWLASNHRDALLDAALSGEGVGRFGEMTIRPHLQQGRLVPALLDWVSREAPPVSLLYHPKQRRTPRVRVFIDWVTALFQTLEARSDDATLGHAPGGRPPWYDSHRSRVSSAVQTRR
jgi:LysR family transcriptional regulator, regulator for bpeEF and oprC